MNGQMKILSLVAGVMSAGLCGCVYHEHPVVYSEPATVVYERPATVVVVHREPPPLIVERASARPGPNHVWVNGYWNADRDRWVWVQGHWSQPPRRGAVWVPPRYDREGTEVRFSVGYWR